MSLSGRMNFKPLGVLDPALRSLGKVQYLVLLCCGLFVAVKVFPPSWRWVTHLIQPGRLRNQILDSRDSAEGGADGINASYARSPPNEQYGLQILHDDPQATVDIVAVHGLGANPIYAWDWNPKNNPTGSNAYPVNPVNWLKDLLPDKIPYPCRVMTFNFNSTWHSNAPKQRLSLISYYLLKELQNQREKEGTEERPLIFIGHSFGGNVIEQAIVSATTHDSPYLSVAMSTLGVIFLGTPHRGSPSAKLGRVIALTGKVLGAATEDSILKALEEHSDTLTDLLQDFSCWLFRQSVPVVCFFEQFDTAYGSKLGPLGAIIPLKQMVVSEYHACIDGHERVPLLTDHFKINKYYGLDDPSFRLVFPEISRMLQDPVNAIQRRRSPKAIPTDDSATSGELKKCIRAALLRDPRDDLASIKRQKGEKEGRTCEWLLGNEKFTTWAVNRNPRLLWLVGSPGIGKTMMSTFLVKELQEKAETAPNIIFAYFFCDNKNELRRTETSILRSVIRQLLLQNHALFDHIRSDFEYRPSDLFEDFDALWRILGKMLRDHRAGEVFVLIDGLDECEISAREGLLRCLPDLFAPHQARSTAKFRFLITCRPEPDIEKTLSDVGASLRVDSGMINNDLREYMDAKVKKLSKTRNYTPGTTEKVQKAFRAKTGTSFLWVSLMIAELENPETNQDEVEKKLESYPVELDVIYARILGQIREDKRDRAQFLLRLMVAARRPLKKYEIATAFGTWKKDLIPPRQDLDMFTDICSSCKSIVYLDTVDESDDANPTVNFVHQSVKDFLLPDRPGADVLWYHIPLDSANLFMLQVCWKYLTMQEFAYGHLIIRRETHPEGFLVFSDLRPYVREHLFLKYASQEWREHALASYPALLESFEVKFKDKLQKAPTLRDVWLLWTAQKGQEAVMKLLLEAGAAYFDCKDNYGQTPLLLAAWYGHEVVAKLLLEKGADVDSKDKYGRTPLFRAASEGQEAVVKLLLEKGAHVNAKDKDGSTPLCWAVSNGYEVVAKLLLEKGADVNVKDKYGQTPLLQAASEGQEAVAKLLLEKGAHINAKDKDGLTPLCWAVLNWHNVVAKLLLEKGADVDSKDNSGRTPLLEAALEGHEVVAKLLLEKGADTNVKDKDGWTPLFEAASKGHEVVAKLLLEKGANIDFKYNNGQTPLLRAVLNGYKGVVKLLLEKGADVNVKDKYGQTPLLQAASEGQEAVAKLLLEKGALVNAKDKNGLTPLCWAILNWHEVVAKLLLEKGADVDSKDNSGRTPLLEAASKGQEVVVKLLLEKGAHVNAKDEDGLTPLCWAILNRHEVVAKLLLEKGADINVKDKDGWTPLYWATSKGHEVVVKLLLEKGANVNVKDKYGQTPLLWATSEGQEAVAKLLLEKGAHINAKDEDSLTPLCWAILNGHEVVAKLLLEKGADINVKDKDGWTPLCWAASKGHEVVVKLLLEKGADVNVKDKDSSTPLLWAASEGQEVVVKLLLEKGANVDFKDNSGWTPLLRAALKGQEAVVKLLLEKGAHVNAKDEDGWTPLCWAVLNGYEVVAKLLLEKGADINVKDKDGWTPLCWAALKGHEVVVKLLQEKGADVDSKDNEGRTALSFAIQEGNEAVVKLLESKA